MVLSSSTPTGVAEQGFRKDRVLSDYRLAYRSRQASLIGRTEVLTGKAKFGIFGDGKEVAQLALAKALRPGDFRSGYYRDQTLMMALDLLSVEEYFAQLYADPDVRRDPASAGRQMNSHFATRLLNEDGSWKPQLAGPNSAADLSPTASQMPKMVGLAYASKLYREMGDLGGLEEFAEFSSNGNELVAGTIGNASCAEGMFWESINAVGVLGGPLLMSIWDDGYGISVPNEQQVTKGDLSALLQGFRRQGGDAKGYDLYTVKGWDYPNLCETYRIAAEIVRHDHAPAIVHVVELTQPQGHSTSGSHERYKSAERLAWEKEFDCNRRLRDWIVAQGLATPEELEDLEKSEKLAVRESQRRAWQAYREPIEDERREVLALLDAVAQEVVNVDDVHGVRQRLERVQVAQRRDLLSAAGEVLVAAHGQGSSAADRLSRWKKQQEDLNADRFSSDLYSASSDAALQVPMLAAEYPDEPEQVNGSEILNACFDAALARYPNLIAFGQDLGRLGDVNQGFVGLQEKYGALRVADTGIRETTILGQAIGLALRGFRPLAEIQYLDYLLYALQIISDDLATLRWRTKGGQKAPVIIRTRGHRLEGVWHAGSPMGGILNLVRGLYLCVPRNMTQAAGMYNTLLRSDDPAIVVEVLNGYRAKEALPTNVGEFTVALGEPEILREGKDVTVVTYGACCRPVLEAAELLGRVGVDVEVVDVQTLLPFDRPQSILQSLQKTSRLAVVDEDVPGGASAYILQRVLEDQGGYHWLDAQPLTVSAKEHRPAYGSDGDYFSKPNREEIVSALYGLMRRGDPQRFPDLGM